MRTLIFDGENIVYKEIFKVKGGDFAAAGEVSGKIKQILKKLGIDAALIRRIAIVSYEAELNMVIHSFGGEMRLYLEEDQIRIVCEDTGPGIPDIQLAMKEGYSTAPDSVRMMGFGAGMGLPNMNKNSDELKITSDSNGTVIDMIFHL